MTLPRSPRLFNSVAVLILLAALALRLYHLGAPSFWNDEGNSARLSERSLRLILEGTASDIHPPLYYLILRGWRELAGESEFSLRAVSAYSGVLLTAFTLHLGRRYGSVGAALVAGVGVALNPALIAYSQEARMYMLLALLALAATALLWRWAARQGRGWALGYTACLAAGLYTHYFFPVVIGVHTAWLVLSRRGRAVGGRWVALVGLAGLLYAPWWPVALGSLGGNRGAPQPGITFVMDIGRFFFLGATSNQPIGPAVWLAWLLAGLILSWRARPAALLWLGVGAPVAALLVVRATDAAFYKFALMVIPWGWLLLALAADTLLRVTPRRLVRPLLALALTGGALWLVNLTAHSLLNLYTNPVYARADYRGMAQRIAAEGYADAAVILDAPNQWEVFTYYHRQGAPVIPLPLAGMGEEEISAELTRLTAAHTHLYALFWGDHQQDPQAVVETWLNGHTFKVREEWVGDVRFLLYYAAPRAASADMRTTLDIPFGDAIRLRGYTLSPDRVQPGDVLTLTLFWQATAPLNQRYKVFVHLSGPDGVPLAQRDSEPQGGLAPTTTWTPGVALADPYGLLVPFALPPGEYALTVGLYDIAAPDRRLVAATPAGQRDSLLLATISVQP